VAQRVFCRGVAMSAPAGGWWHGINPTWFVILNDIWIQIESAIFCDWIHPTICVY